jgi:hypothetical protein
VLATPLIDAEKLSANRSISNRPCVEHVEKSDSDQPRVPKEVAVAATMTLWVNTITGERLDRDALDDLRHKAHRTYEANSHIFEDEYEALTALGAVPLSRLNEGVLGVA